MATLVDKPPVPQSSFEVLQGIDWSHALNIQERQQLLAERSSLERTLASLPESSVIDRLSLEARKSRVEQALAAAPAPSHEPGDGQHTSRSADVGQEQGSEGRLRHDNVHEAESAEGPSTAP